MNIVQINTVCGIGSTGKICVGISKLLTERHIENHIFYTSCGSDYPLGIRYASDRYIKVQALRSRIAGNYGFNSQSATRSLLRALDEMQPDAVQLHNLHGHNVHLPILFNGLKDRKARVYWTLHDCWAFTAYCPHFTLAHCDKWRTGCRGCPQYRRYSWFFDKGKLLYERKKSLFSGLDMTLVAPSQWLADLVKQSFLKEYPVRVIHNGIDLAVFHPTVSDVRARYRLGDRYVLLGVAFGWDRRKGLDVFVELSRRLGDGYQIVLVGVDERTERLLPDNVISIRRTNSQRELAELYSAADLFVNPTREEVLGLVNIEALACGTPVVTFDTGGSPETIDATCGASVPCGDVDALEAKIRQIASERPYPPAACVRRAESFDEKARYEEYLELYGENLS